MRTKDACIMNSKACPFFTGECLSQFGHFACDRCRVRNFPLPLFGAAVENPACQIYRILVFTHAHGPSGYDMRWNIHKMYPDACIDFVDCLFLSVCPDAEGDLDVKKIVDNIWAGRYNAIYIDIQDRDERQAMRKLFKDRYNLDLHIQKYAKLAEVVNRRRWIK